MIGQNSNIEKYNSVLFRDNSGFTTILNKVIQSIDDAELLGLYVYLTTMPPKWKINKTQLKNHFKVGERKIDSLFKKLRECGLLSIIENRDKGKFMGINYKLHLDFIRTAEIDTTVYNRTAETAPAETAPTVFAPLINNIDINEIDIKDISPSISPPKVEKPKKQKDILSLEDILKDNPYNLTKESLRDWLAVRKTKRLPLTETAWKKQLNQLNQFKANGCDPSEVFTYGVGKGWASIEIGYDGILERFSAIDKGHLNPQPQKTKKDVEDDLKKRDEESVARAQKQAEKFLKEKGIDISQTKGFPTGQILKVINK